ncbi:heavy metal translocating P-type ATPase [Marinitenerispora sediminis]|uniref:Heavy metal translocating P-type ATPase n=1 Tax=Marinitenerispora sediminis TaxID=1931232 RepID=A0A368TAH9_9ACTN|nr:heavy metal translocating P-type ATPase [Marinitenerispora sediminis]RCV52859.1 heavy metal translocating P-type ATPase [Marinitenerispora sediminis]RCV60035.1 heavy metal translocating P-type ATPase [Marinitenerispora sediminis]RCV61942.1 heavy metal translocating P-type ATPase [Marinitenerispora sediminis]
MADTATSVPVRSADAHARLRRRLEPALLVVTVAALVGGAAFWFSGQRVVADVCWAAGTLVAVVPALAWVVAALRRRRAGVDLIAVLALAGTLAVGEYVAGCLIAVMLASGRTLEAAAGRRAARDLRALLERAPRFARRRTGGRVDVIALADARVGDVLVTGSGEVVAVDGRVLTGPAMLDESALTGEPTPVERGVGEPVRSGVVNAGGAFDIEATATAADSTYAHIVRLAEQAGAQRAPVVRLAERYAAWFLPLSLAVAGIAWLVGGSAIRAVAVLVVATPCPLLLAAPVAVVSGLSRAARQGVVVRDGGALERLGRARTLLLDKTGTLTVGRPRVRHIIPAPGRSGTEVLSLAASLDQMSAHVLAEAIVTEARARGLVTLPADGVVEEPGSGVRGRLDGRYVTVGRTTVPADARPGWARSAENRALLDDAAIVWLTVDGALTGAILLRDPLRPEAPRTLRRLREAGVSRLLMLTGDRPEPAREVAAVVGLDGVRAEQTPADKVAAVRAESGRAVTVMVGDGINDAPALAAADVGVAMGARGSTASSEAADVVLTTDRVDRIADTMEIAVRARRIAVQSAAGGMALSLLAMVAALLGWLPPAPGALVQEAIDVAVIVNALRALLPGRGARPSLEADTTHLLHRFAAEHERLADDLDAVRDAAGLLAAEHGPRALAAVRNVDRMLTERVLPHEHAEERELYPALAASLGGPEATATMSRAHAEIDRLANRIGAHLRWADSAGGLVPEQLDDLRSCLYGLHSVLRLHFRQEEESYFSLAP